MGPSLDVSEYERLATKDWQPSLDSIGSEDSGDVEDTSPMLAERERTQKRRHCLRSPLFYLLDLFFLAACFILLFQKPGLRPLDCGGDVTGYVPSFPQEVVTFRSHPEFISNHSSEASLAEAQVHWKELVPPGQGFLKITEEEAEKYDFPKLIHYKGTTSLGTSVMHSLHCLYVIMAEYDMLAQGRKSFPLDTEHMDHCIDYVRQMLMCGGDMALAGEDLPNGSSQLDVPHVCKSWDRMYDWLYDHRDNDAWQFGHAETHYVPP